MKGFRLKEEDRIHWKPPPLGSRVSKERKGGNKSQLLSLPPHSRTERQKERREMEGRAESFQERGEEEPRRRRGFSFESERTAAVANKSGKGDLIQGETLRF